MSGSRGGDLVVHSKDEFSDAPTDGLIGYGNDGVSLLALRSEA